MPSFPACNLAHLTMLSSFISLRSEISRIAVEGTPSSSCSRRIFLSATISPVLFAVLTARRDHRQKVLQARLDMRVTDYVRGIRRHKCLRGRQRRQSIDICD